MFSNLWSSCANRFSGLPKQMYVFLVIASVNLIPTVGRNHFCGHQRQIWNMMSGLLFTTIMPIQCRKTDLPKRHIFDVMGDQFVFS